MKVTHSIFLIFFCVASSCGESEEPTKAEETEEKKEEAEIEPEMKEDEIVGDSTCANTCASPQICLNTACVNTCADDSQCDSGESCETSVYATFKHCQTTTPCSELKNQYETEANNYPLNCDVDTDCRWVAGHCNVGIGGCFYPAGKEVESNLEALKTAILVKQCSFIDGVCGCIAEPVFRCEENLCVYDLI